MHKIERLEANKDAIAALKKVIDKKYDGYIQRAADACGLSRSSISQILNGLRPATRDKRARIESMLGVPADLWGPERKVK